MTEFTPFAPQAPVADATVAATPEPPPFAPATPVAEAAPAVAPADTGDVARLIPSATIFVIPADEEEGTPQASVAIHRFSFIKSMMLLECLGDLAERVDIASIFSGSQIHLDALVEKLPVLMRTMRSTVTRALALTLMKNKEIEQLADNEEDLEAALAPYRAAVYRLDIGKAAELLTIAIDRIGVQEIRRNFPALLAALRAN